MSVRRFPITAAFLIASLAACEEADGTRSNPRASSGPFGEDFESMDAGAAPAPADGSDGEGGGSDEVQLRVLQGVLNLRESYVCHAPDFDLEHTDAGFETAVELPLTAAESGLEFGKLSDYISVQAITGAITVHRSPNPDAGYVDAAVADAALADGGSADAGAGPAAPPRCDPASLEAVLPLPMPPAWVDPPADAGAPPEAGLSIEARGFVSTVSGGAPLTLFGSGRMLERAELERRVEEEKARYLTEHADDAAGAQAAAERYKHGLEATYGPRFLLSRAQPARRKLSFSLQFVHLIPDVPGPPDAGSGALHLCMTIGAMESSELGDAGASAAVFDFRNNAVLGDDLDPAPAYRFRVFVQSAYAEEKKTCATTSLKPVAEKVVDPESFKADHSYTLVALGAMFPEAICTSSPGSLIRPGCAPVIEDPGASLELIEN